MDTMTSPTQHLTIQQMAERSGLTTHTLRYYERVGLLRSVERTESGHRRYRADDAGWIGLITCLRETGMPIRDALAFAEIVNRGEETIPERIAFLRAHEQSVRAEIAAMEQRLRVISDKIDYYVGTVEAAPEETTG